MSSRRKKLSRTINVPVSATVDDVVSALLSLALPDGDILASISEHFSPHASVDIPETTTTTFATITATTTEAEEMPSIIHQQHIAINHKDSADALEHLQNPDPKSSTSSFLDILQKNDWTPRQLSPKENVTSIQRLEISQPSTQPPISLSTLMEQLLGVDIPRRTITPLEASASLRTAMSENEDLLGQESLEYSGSFFSDPDPDPSFGESNTHAAAMSLDKPDPPQEPRANVQEPDQGHRHGLTHGSGANVDNTKLGMAARPVLLPLCERPRELATFDTAFAAFQNPSRHEEDAHRATIHESISQPADRTVRYSSWNDEFRSTRTGQETDVPKPVANTGLGLESGSSSGTNIDQSLRHPFESRRSFRRVEQAKRSVPDITEEYWREPWRRQHSTTDLSNDTTPNHPLLDKEELKCCLQEEDYTQVTPFTFIHTDRYLEPVTKNNPLVTIRLVFLSSQLPRSVAFTKMMLPLRNKHLIDTFLIPHETQPTHPDADVVLGFSGALTRVLLSLKEFLQELAPKPRRFYMWRLCVLIPHRIHFLFIGEQDHSLVYDEENDMAESSIPQLRKCLGRRYGPVSEDAPDEHILTLESCTLDRIMDALRFVAETMARDEECYGPADDGMYLGGRPSAIPAAIMHHADHFRGAMQAKMHVGLPVGYLVRPDMAQCLRRMQLRPYHLQLLLTLAQASYVIGRHGDRIYQLQESTGAILELSRNVKSIVRVCDVGGHELETIVGAVGTVVESMYRSAVAEWEVGVYVPQRVAVALDSDETRMALMAKDVEVEILALEEAEQRVREHVIRLEEGEVECVVRFMSASEQAGIEHAVRTTLAIMYRNAEE